MALIGGVIIVHYLFLSHIFNFRLESALLPKLSKRIPHSFQLSAGNHWSVLELDARLSQQSGKQDDREIVLLVMMIDFSYCYV